MARLHRKAAPPPQELKAQKANEREERKRNRPRTNDPKLVSAARELRDRYMEEANIAGRGLLPGACDGISTSPYSHAPVCDRRLGGAKLADLAELF